MNAVKYDICNVAAKNPARRQQAERMEALILVSFFKSTEPR